MKGWFRRMSKSAAETTKRLEDKYGDDIKHAGSSVSGRMSVFRSALKEKSAVLKQTIKKKLEEREAEKLQQQQQQQQQQQERQQERLSGVGTRTGTGGAASASAHRFTIDSEEEDEEVGRGVGSEGGDAPAPPSQAMLALELAGLGVKADFDLRKWDGVVRVRLVSCLWSGGVVCVVCVNVALKRVD